MRGYSVYAISSRNPDPARRECLEPETCWRACLTAQPKRATCRTAMAVYTEVSDEDLNTFIAQYPLGAVLSCKGIAEGVENSNYLLVTETGPYILTLYEKRVRRDDLPFFLGLM